MPDGPYHVFAAAFPQTSDPLTYLLPDSSAVLVGAGQRPLVLRGGAPQAPVDVALRRMRPTDPPILVALPALLFGGGDARPAAA